METALLQRKINRLLKIFLVALVFSGLTAFPLETELAFLNAMDLGPESLQRWIHLVYQALEETNDRFPFLAYGTDWLAFAHLAIAVFFLGPLKDPVRNVWIIKAGMLISIGIFPLAFIAGSIRGIPFYWQLIDCSFGLFSFLLLNYCLQLIKELEHRQHQQATSGSGYKELLVCPFHKCKTTAITN